MTLEIISAIIFIAFVATLIVAMVHYEDPRFDPRRGDTICSALFVLAALTGWWHYELVGDYTGLFIWFFVAVLIGYFASYIVTKD